MKIVIDIPEETYNFIKQNSSGSTAHEAIKNGQPLPKGHGRMIDADAFFQEFSELDTEPYINEPTIIEAEQEEPTIEEESETDRLEKTLKPCPFCGGQAHIMRMGYPHYIYCENCGAKIHGGKIGDGAEEASVKAWNRRRLPATKIFQASTAEDIFRAAAKSKELGDYIRGLFEEVWEAHQKREEEAQ